MQFLEIVARRHNGTATAFFQSFREEDDARKCRDRGESINLEPFSYRRMQLAGEILVDVESFYLFSKILLGKVARVVEFYFGPGRGKKASLLSHHRLTKNLKEYAGQKGLTEYDRVLELAERLQDDVVEYRDKQIEHEGKMVVSKGLNFMDTAVSSASCSLDGVQVNSIPVDRLEEDICAYLKEAIAFIQANSSHFRFEDAIAQAIPAESQS